MQVCGGGGLVLELAAELWLADLTGNLLIQQLLNQWSRFLPCGSCSWFWVWKLCLGISLEQCFSNYRK